MGMIFTQYFKPRTLKVLVLGLDAAGKTTLLYRIKDGRSLPGSIPTIGFNTEEVQMKGVNLTMWDIGGQDKVQEMWRHYYYGVNTLVFVVDSSDRERIFEARLALENVLLDPHMHQCIVLIYANKQDVEGAMGSMEVAKQLGLSESNKEHWFIQPSCAITGDGLLEGLEWMVNEEKERRKKKKKKHYFRKLHHMQLMLRPRSR